MLWNGSKITGYAISASDGKIGKISDFFFDDTNWLVRWLVVDTGNWLSGRKVLLPTSAMDHLDTDKEECSIKLTKKQIEESPTVDTDQPVSRQMETDVYGYYGYSPYWNSGYGMTGGAGMAGGYGYMGGMGGAMPVSSASKQREEEMILARKNSGDVHLRSVEEVTGYHINATDGEIGHVEDVIIQDADWGIHYLVIDTKNWWRQSPEDKRQRGLRRL
jgi:sporulation protein YlmC with PRC-barrel domain